MKNQIFGERTHASYAFPLTTAVQTFGVGMRKVLICDGMSEFPVLLGMPQSPRQSTQIVSFLSAIVTILKAAFASGPILFA